MSIFIFLFMSYGVSYTTSGVLRPLMIKVACLAVSTKASDKFMPKTQKDIMRQYTVRIFSNIK
jgi:hypothetical protein